MSATTGSDEFNNLSSRNGHYALNPDTSDGGTFVNNKRTNTGWSYDADGRILTSVDTSTSTNQTWTYDAAGNQLTIAEVSAGTTTTNTLSYDGDGQLLFESVTTPQSTKSDYLIRSTVLGSILTKLDALGNKDTTYVPTNGLGFPLQTKDSNGNPTVGGVLRDVTGLQEDGKAVDPFGAVIQNVQPPQSPPSPNMPFYGATYGGVTWNSFVDANNFSSGCVLDGQRIDCNRLKQLFNDGFVDYRIPSGLTDTTTYDPQRPLGYFETRGEFGHARFFITGPVFGSDPQKPSGVMAPIGGLDRMQMWLEEALKYGDCREALQKVLGQIGSDTNFAPSHNDILDVFNALRGQTRGGGIFVDVPWGESENVFPPGVNVGKEGAGGGGESALWYTDPSNWRTRQRAVIVYLRGAYSDSQPMAFERIPYDYVSVLIHELTHSAPNDSSGAGRYYEHDEMDAAAKKLGSVSFDRYVREHCIPEKYWRPQK